MRSLTFSVLFVLFLSAFGLSDNAEWLVYFETQANAVSKRSDKAIKIEHFEIPLSEVEKLQSTWSDKAALESLVFKKDGSDYVRWIINPEDTKWNKEVIKWLKKNGLDSTKYQYYTGYQTSSRTYVIEDPVTGAEFMAKASTNKTGGWWADKKQEWTDAREVKMAADHIQNAIKKYTPKNFKYMDESLVFGLAEINQGIVVRSLQKLTDSQFYYLPGFSAVHDKIGREIAKKNGSADPLAYWNEHYNKPLGRALAEFAVMTGMSYDSPHSQNFLVELDKNFRPTGKIILRDTGDIYVTAPYTRQFNSRLVKEWPKDNKVDYIWGGVGILHGNNKPKWINEQEYSGWGIDFFREYDLEMAKLTGIDPDILIKYAKPDDSDKIIDPYRRISRDGDYIGKGIRIYSEEWKQFLDKLNRQGGFKKPARYRCSEFFI
jgi:hypothetical protein